MNPANKQDAEILLQSWSGSRWKYLSRKMYVIKCDVREWMHSFYLCFEKWHQGSQLASIIGIFLQAFGLFNLLHAKHNTRQVSFYVCPKTCPLPCILSGCKLYKCPSTWSYIYSAVEIHNKQNVTKNSLSFFFLQCGNEYVFVHYFKMRFHKISW